LGIELSEVQKQAVTDAHYAMSFMEKVTILKQAGFSAAQRRALFESHLVGLATIHIKQQGYQKGDMPKRILDAHTKDSINSIKFMIDHHFDNWKGGNTRLRPQVRALGVWGIATEIERLADKKIFEHEVGALHRIFISILKQRMEVKVAYTKPCPKDIILDVTHISPVRP